MSQTAVALIAVATLISLGQWAWTLAVSHVDPGLLPGCYERHVRWLRAHSSVVQGLAGVVAVAGACLFAA